MKTGGERSRWQRSKTSHSPSLISTSRNTSAGRTICTEYLLNACLWEPTTSCMGKRQQGAKCNMAPLVRFIGDGDKPQQSSQKQEGGMACHHLGSVNRFPCGRSHLKGQQKRGHCKWVPPMAALTPLGTHHPAAATSGQHPHMPDH